MQQEPRQISEIRPQFNHEIPIFMEIHFSETKKLIQKKRDEVNLELEREWRKDKKEFKKKYAGYFLNPDHPKYETQTFRCVTIKSSEMTTAYYILDMYATFLKRNRTLMLFGATFKLNNVAVATKHGCGTNKSTSWRHISKLMDFGILQNKVLHGHKCSYDIEFNPKLLSAAYNERYCGLLVDNYKKMFKTEKIHPEMLTRLISMKPMFTDFPKGCMIADCNASVARTLLELNSNMKCGIRFADDFLSFQEHKAIDQENKKIPGAISGDLTKDQQDARVSASTHGTESLTRDQNERLKIFLQISWSISRSMLFDKKIVSEADMREINHYIMLFFISAVKSGGNTLVHRYNNFVERNIMFKKFLIRHPEFTIMAPQKWFDPNQKLMSFCTTKEWLDNTLKKRKKDKEYNLNNYLLAKLFRKYFEEPTPDNYQKAVQRLSKMRSKFHLNEFNKHVLSRKEMTVETFDRIREFQDTYSINEFPDEYSDE